MTKPDTKADQARADRRSFLKLAGAGAVTAGGAAVAGGAQAAPAPQSSDDQGLYRETAHVKRYYDLARF